MIKNRLMIISVMMCLILGTIPFALGATTPTTTNTVTISSLYVGAPKQIANQEYVKITNSGKIAVNMKGWKIVDKKKLHTYIFPSYTLKAKSTVTLKSGTGRNSASILFWNKGSFVWNNEGDTASLYNAQGRLVSTKVGYKQK